MEKIKNFFKSKSYGFYVSVAVCILSLIAVCAYALGYGGTKYMSWLALIIVVIGVAVSILLMIFKQDKFVPAVILIATFVSMLSFVYGIYLLVVTTFYAASVVHFSGEFIAAVVFYIIAIVVGIANVFFKQVKEGEKKYV